MAETPFPIERRGSLLVDSKLRKDWPFAASNLRLLDGALDHDSGEHGGLLQNLDRKILYGRPETYDDILLQFRVQEAISQERYRLPLHLFPVVLERGPLTCDRPLGAIVPFEARKAFDTGYWVLDKRCLPAEPGVEEEPTDWLLKLVARLEQSWGSSPLPLMGRCGLKIELGLDILDGQIDGRSFELPLVITILRECCHQHTGEWPFGPGPVFATGTITGVEDKLEPVDGLEWKLDAFLRECGDGHAAILLPSQAARLSYLRPGFEQRFGQIEKVKSLPSLMALPQFRAGLEAIAAQPNLRESQRLVNWVQLGRPHVAMTTQYLQHWDCLGPRDSTGELRGPKLREWSEAVTQDRLEALNGTKYFPDCYVERAGLESRVRKWFDGGRTPALLVAAGPGSGKTSLLCRIADGHLLGEDSTTVHLIVGSPSGTPKGEQPLLRRLRQDFDLKEESFRGFLELWRRANPDRRLVLVIDAVNEAADPQDLFNDLVDMATAARQVAGRGATPWARIVASIRIESLFALESRGSELDTRLFADFTPVKPERLASFEREEEKRFYLQLQLFTESEAEEAYSKYAAGQGSFCPMEWRSLPETTRELLQQPILMRLFHEVFAGDIEPTQLSSGYQLWDAYLGKIFGHRKHLKKAALLLAKMCLERGASEPTWEIVRWFDKQWRIQAGLDYGIAVKHGDEVLQQLVEEGLLRKESEGGWAWSSDLAAEQLYFLALHAEDRSFSTDCLARWCVTLPETARRNAALTLVGQRLWDSARWKDLLLLTGRGVIRGLILLRVPRTTRPGTASEYLFRDSLSAISRGLTEKGTREDYWRWQTALEEADAMLENQAGARGGCKKVCVNVFLI